MRPEQPPPDLYAYCRRLLWVLCGALAGAYLSACANAPDLSGSDDPESSAPAILVVILVIPDGTYKDYVRYYPSMKDCVDSMPKWTEEINTKMDSQLSYAMTCQNMTPVGAKAL